MTKKEILKEVINLDAKISKLQNSRSKLLSDLGEILVPKGTILTYKGTANSYYKCKVTNCVVSDSGSGYLLNSIYGVRILKSGNIGRKIMRIGWYSFDEWGVEGHSKIKKIPIYL